MPNFTQVRHGYWQNLVYFELNQIINNLAGKQEIYKHDFGYFCLYHEPEEKGMFLFTTYVFFLQNYVHREEKGK